MMATKLNLLAVLTLVSIQFHLQFLPKFIEAAISNVHIVYMGEKKHEDPATTKMSQYEMLSTLLGSKKAAKNSMLYSYKHGFSGFAARLTESQAAEIAAFPGVLKVFPNRIHKLRTTRSWEFMGLNDRSSENLLTESNMGEGTIIGVLDSGVWPESESFNDRDMSPIPSRWKGICQEGLQFNSSNCNKKLIGARWFIKGILEHSKTPVNISNGEEFLSARDNSGHGTHTASTAAGNFVENANYAGLAAGMARGGAPRAHLAVYKVCWSFSHGGCSDADILKAFDKAIQDGVDILSVSIGSSIPLFFYTDQRNSIAVGSFHATAKGITVACSAGNNGPTAMTVENTAPWIITVAAATIDRAFPTAITLGNNRTLWGQSIDTGMHSHGFTGITFSDRIAVDPSDDSAQWCERGSLNATLAAGKIILCFSQSRTQNIFSAAVSVREAGGVGLIFAQHRNDGLDSCGFLPCIKVDYEVGTEILSYIRKARSPIAKLSIPKTVIGKWLSPRVADFSARGPSSISPAVLKPDVAAPGVDILAAYIPLDKAKISNGHGILSGTSMSCPHVAGIAALIKSVHKQWSPAAIRSALVTTASQTAADGSNIAEEGSTRKAADPFDMGGGHVNPNKAVDPGLIYDAGIEDYVQFLCGTGFSSKSVSGLTQTKVYCSKTRLNELNLNLPSITIPYLKRKVTVTRKVTNVGPVDSVYKATIQAPEGIKMKVEPQILSFNMENDRVAKRFGEDNSLTPTSLTQASIAPLPLPSTQFSSQNNMLDPATKLPNSPVSLSDHRGRRLSDSYDGYGSRVQKTAQNYANYMGLNGLEGRFGAETSMVEDHDVSGVSTPPLWRRTSPSRSPPHRQSINYRCLSPSSKAEAIARGQRELMEIVSRMPEACYELTLRDLVEHQPVAVEPKLESFAEGRGIVNEEKGNEKKKKNPKPQINRSGSVDNGGFLLKMVFPISLGSKKKKKKKKKNDYDTNHNCKVSPKPSISDASGKSVDKEWWKKRSGSSESESGGSTVNSGSTKSTGSSSISSSSSGSCRSISNSSRRHMRGGCLAFILTMKGKASS